MCVATDAKSCPQKFMFSASEITFEALKCFDFYISIPKFEHVKKIDFKSFRFISPVHPITKSSHCNSADTNIKTEETNNSTNNSTNDSTNIKPHSGNFLVMR